MPDHNPEQPLNRQDRRKLRNLAERAKHHPDLVHYHRAWLLSEPDQLEADPKRTVHVALDLDRLSRVLLDVGVTNARGGRFSWDAIGEWFGVSRAAAHNRFGSCLLDDRGRARLVEMITTGECA